MIEDALLFMWYKLASRQSITAFAFNKNNRYTSTDKIEKHGVANLRKPQISSLGRRLKNELHLKVSKFLIQRKPQRPLRCEEECQRSIRNEKGHIIL